MGIISIGLILISYTHFPGASQFKAESRLYDTRKSSLLLYPSLGLLPNKQPVAGRHTLGRFEFPQERGRSIIFASVWLPVAGWQHGTQRPFSASLACASVAGSLAELPALSFQNLLHLVQDLLFLRRALAVLGTVRWRDDDRFVRDHLDIVPADGDVTVNIR